jgi:hypothetical protein
MCPCWWSSRAIASPIPDEAPVIKTTPASGSEFMLAEFICSV